MAPNLAEIEKMADEHLRIKQVHEGGEEEDAERLVALAGKIIDSLSAPDFTFPIRDEALVNDGTTTYVYENGAAYPKLYDFLSEILHAPVPIVINEAKFGPGEIIVGAGDKDRADVELQSAVKELQKLIHGKKTKATQ